MKPTDAAANLMFSAASKLVGLDQPTRFLVRARKAIEITSRLVPKRLKRIGARALLSGPGASVLGWVFTYDLADRRRELESGPWLRYIDALEANSPGICLRLYLARGLVDVPSIARALKLSQSYRQLLDSTEEKRSDALRQAFLATSHYVERFTSTVLLGERICRGDPPISHDPALRNLVDQYNLVAAQRGLPKVDPLFVDARNSEAHTDWNYNPTRRYVHLSSDDPDFTRSLEDLQNLLDQTLKAVGGYHDGLQLRMREFAVATVRETGLQSALLDIVEGRVTPASRPDLVNEIDARFASIDMGHIRPDHEQREKMKI